VEPAFSRPPLNEEPARQPIDSITDQLTSATDELRRAQQELAAVQQQLSDERAELARLQAQGATASSATSLAGTSTDSAMAAEAAGLTAAVETARQELVELNDSALLQQVGIYEYHHPLENADAYKERLTDLRARIKDSVKAKARSSPPTGLLTTTLWRRDAG
jgi:predicted  nucleic acid-binding Zn-ribbon protein